MAKVAVLRPFLAVATDKMKAKNIAELQARTEFKEGDVVEVLGEITAGDGKHHMRIASTVADASGAQGQGGLFWNVVPNSLIEAVVTAVGDNKSNIASAVEDINYSQTPIGTVVPFVSDTIPLGWLLCDGREVKETDYPDLYKLLGYGRNIGDLDSLSKHEVPVMTSNSSGGFVASASSVYDSNFQPFECFDGKYASEDCWVSTKGVKEGWVQLQYPKAKNFNGFSITSRNEPVNMGYKINYIKIETSNDGVIWTKQFEENVSVFGANETRKYKFVNDFKSYLYVRCSVAMDSSDQFASIGELEYFTNDIENIVPPQILAQDPTKKYLPFMQGVFAKGNVVGRELGSYENDAIRNMTAELTGMYGEVTRMAGCTGFARGTTATTALHKVGFSTPWNNGGIVLDVSTQVPTADENRPKNISFNYIIKATTVHNPSTVVPVVDEVNRKIEVNRVGVAENKATGVKNTEDIAKGNESVVLWEGNSTGGQVTLIEDYTNFKWIVVEGNYNANELSGNVVVETKTIRKTVTGGVSKNEYAITISGRYMSVIFNPNNSQIGISRLTAGMVLSKVIGVGRV